MLFHVSLSLNTRCLTSNIFPSSHTHTLDFSAPISGGQTGRGVWKQGTNPKFLQLQLPPEEDPSRTPKSTSWLQHRLSKQHGRGVPLTPEQGFEVPWNERAVRCLEQELEAHWGPTAVGWAVSVGSNAKCDKLAYGFFKILHDTHSNFYNSKGGPMTPAANWFK